jgi:hypothetical protein
MLAGVCAHTRPRGQQPQHARERVCTRVRKLLFVYSNRKALLRGGATCTADGGGRRGTLGLFV